MNLKDMNYREQEWPDCCYVCKHCEGPFSYDEPPFCKLTHRPNPDYKKGDIGPAFIKDYISDDMGICDYFERYVPRGTKGDEA